MSIKGNVCEYIMKRPGEVLWKSDIAHELEITGDQVLSGIQNSKQTNEDFRIGLSNVEHGQAWKYMPNSHNAPKKQRGSLFEEIGRSKDGDIILEDENNKLYRAKEL